MDITDAAKRKREELVRAEWEQDPDNTYPRKATEAAFDRYIQQTSDVAKQVDADLDARGYFKHINERKALQSLILPDEPVNLHISTDDAGHFWVIPYPLVEKALANLGLKIVEAPDD